MRIALLSSGIWPMTIGGIQKHSYYFVKSFLNLNVSIDLYSTFDSLEQAEDFKNLFNEDEKKRLFIFPINSPQVLKFPGHYIWKMYQISKSIKLKILPNVEKYDIIYVQGFTGWCVYNLAKSKSITTILNFHGFEMFQKSFTIRTKLEQYLLRPFVKISLRKTDYIQSLGKGLTKIIKDLGIKSERIIELPIAVDEKWLENNVHYNQKTSTKRYVFIGRYERRKGVDDLNQVLERISSNTPIQFDIIGPIPEVKKVNKRFVNYHGQIADQNNIISILDQADFLVCPSYSEGMPTVILEAMSREVAIISTDVGAITDVVDSTNGFLFKAGDIDKLYQLIIETCNIDDKELNLMKVSSRKKIELMFNWNHLAKRMYKEFEKLRD